MANISIRLDGTSLLLRKLAVGGAKVSGHVSMAIYEEAWEIFRQSQIEVPYRHGFLAGSGRVDPPTIINNEILVQIFYGGAAAPYALWVHENRDMNFRNGRKAKYLYDPVMKRMRVFDKNIATRIEHMLRNA
jgi:hypothetical protein